MSPTEITRIEYMGVNPFKMIAQKIIEVVKEKLKITRLELANEIGISAESIKERLERLKKRSIIRRVGHTSGWLLGVN
jgi:DNA-binding Lrp family transcriptional regulator